MLTMTIVYKCLHDILFSICVIKTIGLVYTSGKTATKSGSVFYSKLISGTQATIFCHVL